MDFLTPDETVAVLNTARQRSVRDWAMILLTYKHGLRASETCDLKLADVDIRGEAVTVRRLKNSMTTTQPLYRHRGMPLLDEVAALKKWMKERPNDGSDFVFTSQKGGKLHRSQFFRLFRAHALRAGLARSKAHPHALKHTLASYLVAQNTNLALVKQALGHRSITSTLAYVGISDRQAAEAAQVAFMRM